MSEEAVDAEVKQVTTETEAAKETPDVSNERGLMSTVKLGLALLLLVVVAVFALQNLESVNVDFLVWEFDIPQIVLILLSCLFGITAWEILSFFRRPKKSKSSDKS